MLSHFEDIFTVCSIQRLEMTQHLLLLAGPRQLYKWLCHSSSSSDISKFLGSDYKNSVTHLPAQKNYVKGQHLVLSTCSLHIRSYYTVYDRSC